MLFTLAPEQGDRLLRSWDEPVPITRIGHITETKGMQLRPADGPLVELNPGGYDHLAGEP